jgi:peptide-methionine (S)-S-oxide reductase
VEYDPAKITYAQLLEVFWRNIDPTTPNRQFCDVGSQYRPGVFYHDDEQKRLAEASRKTVTDSGHFDNVAVEITEAGDWYDAEEYHQNFYKKNPDHYYRYRTSCRRDNHLDDLWKDFPGKITPE